MVTINMPRRVVYLHGSAHDLSRAGVQRVFVWLMNHGALLWGWAELGEYVSQVEVSQ